MSAKEDRERGGRETKPGPLPETTPQVFPGPNYDFILQCVFEMQKTVGQLTQAVNTLTEQQKSLSEKLNKISHQIYAAIVVILVFGAILTFFAKGINDLILHRIEAPTTQSQPQPKPQTP
jgi:hypothetical protein